MDRERVIVYIDEETDDGMMWEELNQKGQMQVSVYDEEFESWSEYHHSIVVKSLQEHLTDYTKQVRKEVCDALAISLIKHFSKDAEFTVEEICDWLQKVKDQIQGETKWEKYYLEENE